MSAPIIFVEYATYGRHWYELKGFFRALPKVTGDRGYGDHQLEQDADALWARIVADKEFAAHIDAAQNALEDLGAPIYSDYAAAAIIAQGDLAPGDRELLYRPYELAIPWASIQVPELRYEDCDLPNIREPIRSLMLEGHAARVRSHLQAIVGGKP